MNSNDENIISDTYQENKKHLHLEPIKSEFLNYEKGTISNEEVIVITDDDKVENDNEQEDQNVNKNLEEDQNEYSDLYIKPKSEDSFVNIPKKYKKNYLNFQNVVKKLIKEDIFKTIPKKSKDIYKERNEEN